MASFYHPADRNNYNSFKPKDVTVEIDGAEPRPEEGQAQSDFEWAEVQKTAHLQLRRKWKGPRDAPDM